jgi:hypothetical protein
MTSTVSTETPITEHEDMQVERRTLPGLMPVVFVHGLCSSRTAGTDG